MRAPALICASRLRKELAYALLLSLLSCASTARPLSDSGPATPPNVVLVVADDLGWGDVGYHGARLSTPRIDALVAAGVELDQHYVMPQCTPTRVALLTGRYPSRFAAHCTQASNERALPPGTPTLASLLQAAGYDTALVGKWHLGSKLEWGPQHYGFDHSYGSLAGAVGMLDHRYRIGNPFEQTWQRDGEWLELGTEEDQGHVTDLSVREALSFLRTPREGPFFLFVPFHAVHTPLVEEQSWFEGGPGEEASADRRLYAAAVRHLDAALGAIVDGLEEAGLREDTLLVFLSDNGAQVDHSGGQYPPPDPKLKSFSSNHPLRGKKTQAYEGGIRVPAFASWPGRLAPRKVSAPLHAVDWLPTIARLCAAPGAEELDLDGRDIWPQLEGEGRGEQARTLYWTWGGSGRRWEALRRGDLKIVRKKAGPFELFDLSVDPLETADLAATQPAHLERLIGLYEHERSRDAFP